MRRHDPEDATAAIQSTPPVALSLPEARRLAVAAQGFGPQKATPIGDRLRALAAQVHAFQIDSVNVLVRAHYVPAFARLGSYPMGTLDDLAYKERALFEYWGHAACLLPTALYPLLRYRMHTERAREYLRDERGVYLAAVYSEVGERGPIAAAALADPGQRSGAWWNWGRGKAALEYLYDAGLLAIAGRRGFMRLYDLAERVIPRSAREAASPPPEEAMKRLICLGAQACGVGTLGDIAGYFKLDGWRDRLPAGPPWERPASAVGNRAKPIAKRLVAELVEEGRLLPARVEGWTESAYLDPGARIPATVNARALVTPFDSLVWERRRIARLFGVRYTIELYIPPPKRVYGYYVCLFLLGDTLVARCDLKADRHVRALRAQSAFLEPGHDAHQVAPALAEELLRMRQWLGLERIVVVERGDLAAELARSVGPGASATGS